MDPDSREERHTLEIMLIIICLGLTCLLYAMEGYKMVILNLFFLPVVLGGFRLGRYRAGVLALFCVISASMVTGLRLTDVSAAASPMIICLAVTVWGAVLGLTALLIGTLSDDRMTKLKELHEAYVGVVEVLSQYLQSAHPHLKARSIRVAELSQEVAAAMKLSPREIDDIRVAALLHDVGNIEITTTVIRRAVGTFEDETFETQPCTVQGMDLMLSLGSVLSGAIPLLLNQDESVSSPQTTEPAETSADVPLGARIIRAVRAYVALAQVTGAAPKRNPARALRRLRTDRAAGYDPNVLDALERVVSGSSRMTLALDQGVSSALPDVPAPVGPS
ncbi:MAG: hypothetical protein A2V70_16500 [Planctomycetes bacterium RBG_13_63_9]|nr:MAG: hypothetical protein A2V70_16500 [Planctomycetes bacterium RBG_13_63_9]